MESSPRDPLAAGNWFNSSIWALRTTAVVVGAGWLAVSVATLYYVAQYFACIGNCSPGSSAPILVIFSILLGLVPALLTAGLGYMVVRGLWDDARQKAEEAHGDAADDAAGDRVDPAARPTTQSLPPGKPEPSRS
jgi:hypothetical protein